MGTLQCEKVVPVVIGALGSVTKDVECWNLNIGIVPEVRLLQKTVLLRIEIMLGKVLSFKEAGHLLLFSHLL